MPKKQNTLVSDLLAILGEATDMLPLPLETPHRYIRRLRSMDPRGYRRFISYAKEQKLVTVSKNNLGQKFIALTAKGELELLMQKAGVEVQELWDGKWRLLIFDIPENARHKRDQLRLLLRKYNFYKLQASVFISPYSFNREAIRYLNETGLGSYIRILKVEEVDDDADLCTHFDLQKSRP